jgi:hypothetical protein
MNLKTLRKNQIFSTMSKLLSSPFSKNAAIAQATTVNQPLTQIISLTRTPNLYFQTTNTKIQIENERQQTQGIIYARNTPLR